MTQFKTDFSEYAVDSKPSDWTPRWEASGEEFQVISEVSETVGDKILHIDFPVSKYRALSWNDIGTPSDVEIFARIKSENTALDNARICIRGDGDTNNKIGYTFHIGGDDFYVGRFNANGYSYLDTFDSNTALDDTWYNVRFRVSGESIKTKVWEEHENEPSTWNSEVSNSVVSGEGWAGVGGYYTNYYSSTDFFTVGTDGDSAPDPDYDPREIRVTQTPLEILKGGTPETRLTQLPLEVLSGIPTNRVYQDLVETLSEVSGERITKVYQDSFEILSLSSPISGSKTVVMVIT